MNFLDPYAGPIKSVLRIVAGLLFLHFGIAKLLHFPLVPMFASVTPTAWPEGPAGVIELVTGALLVLGLFTRIVALTHPRARLGNCTGLIVHITTSIRQITDLLNSSPAALTPAQCADLEQPVAGGRAAVRNAHPTARTGRGRRPPWR